MNPFIPLKMANTAIVDGRIDEEIKNNLEKLNIKVIKTVKCNDVDDSISYHPDIVIHPVNHKTLVIAPNVFDYYEDKLYGMGIRIIKGEKILGRKYPEDIAYNVGRLSDIAIHNFKYTDDKLKYYLKKEGLEFVNVNQGYSKCSLAIINDNTAITADFLMYKKLTSLGYKILLIEPGYISLEGQKYGFIGGSSGNLCQGKLVFSGEFSNHPDSQKILSFLNQNNAEFILLSKKTLLDIGTIITLYCH